MCSGTFASRSHSSAERNYFYASTLGSAAAAGFIRHHTWKHTCPKIAPFCRSSNHTRGMGMQAMFCGLCRVILLACQSDPLSVVWYRYRREKRTSKRKSQPKIFIYLCPAPAGPAQTFCPLSLLQPLIRATARRNNEQRHPHLSHLLGARYPVVSVQKRPHCMWRMPRPTYGPTGTLSGVSNVSSQVWE